MLISETMVLKKFLELLLRTRIVGYFRWRLHVGFIVIVFAVDGALLFLCAISVVAEVSGHALESFTAAFPEKSDGCAPSSKRNNAILPAYDIMGKGAGVANHAEIFGAAGIKITIIAAMIGVEMTIQITSLCGANAITPHGKIDMENNASQLQ